MKTIIALNNSVGLLARVELDYDTASTEEIAQAAIDLISSCMSLHEGDSITVTVKE